MIKIVMYISLLTKITSSPSKTLKTQTLKARGGEQAAAVAATASTFQWIAGRRRTRLTQQQYL